MFRFGHLLWDVLLLHCFLSSAILLCKKKTAMQSVLFVFANSRQFVGFDLMFIQKVLRIINVPRIRLLPLSLSYRPCVTCHMFPMAHCSLIFLKSVYALFLNLSSSTSSGVRLLLSSACLSRCVCRPGVVVVLTPSKQSSLSVPVHCRFARRFVFVRSFCSARFFFYYFLASL